MRKAKKCSRVEKLPLRVMFQDEARFGRMSDPSRCWAPPGVRPRVGYQLVREFTHACGAVSPPDGVGDFLILPYMTADVMNLFPAEVARRHAREFISMLYDGAPCHSPTALAIPENMMVRKLPAYCPELNPTEHIRDEIREKFFPNLVLEIMDAVEEQLMKALLFLEKHPATVQSITGFKWIVNALSKG